MDNSAPSTLLIGRNDEKGKLGKALASAEAEFVAIYGRRRVGKTFLVREFFGEAIRFELTGMHGVSMREQLANFASALARAKGLEEKLQPPATWQEAFAQLERHIESLGEPVQGGKHVVFLDELPWLDSPRSKFCPALEHFWNSWASKRSDLLLVVCGSAASWMVRNLVEAKGGLHNRVTRKIRLLPFTLGETRAFLRSRKVDLTDYQVIELFMALGGVPHYLKMAEPGWSAAQIIDRTCFHPQGELRTEFEKLYASLFDKPEEHLAIVRALAKSPGGFTRTGLLAAAGLPSGGTATRRLDELAESGFIRMSVPFGKREKDALIRLADEFSLFHSAWIAPLGKKPAGDGYWLQQRGRPKWRAWSGYAFEGVCLKHASRIKAALGIAGVQTTEAPWRHAGSKTGSGAQIDLLIDRADDTISLCEMKFSEGVFTIDKPYAQALRQKRDTFRRVTRTRKNLFLTMVTTFGIADNAHAKELVANSVLAEELFGE
ncbi:MAG: AAA family ATPase [Oceanipulchritudo sp.]